MDQVAESAIVAAISDRPIERRMEFPANPAARLGRIKTGGEIASFSADAAERAAQRARFGHTVFADRNAGNFNQRGAANAAIGGKKRKEEAGSNALCPASGRSGHCCGLGSPYSKPGTAEDGLPRPKCGTAAPGDNASIAFVVKARNDQSGACQKMALSGQP